MTEETHISSLVVHAKPDRLESVRDAVAELPDTELHACTDRGKIVVVLETGNEQDILQRIEQIGSIPGVITASMVYHHVEEPEPKL